MSEAEKGQLGARTAANSGENGEVQQLLEVLQAANAAPLLPGLDEAPDASTLDLVGKAAESLNAARRARGRPEGSANKRNAEVFDYLERRGFKAPELRLMELVSADPRELAKALAGANAGEPSFDRTLEVLKLQLAAARELMPYKFAKRQELKVDVNKTTAHIIVSGQLTQQQTGVLLQQGQMIDIAEYSESNQQPATPTAATSDLKH